MKSPVSSSPCVVAALLASLFSLFLARPALAANSTWTTVGNGNWNTSANWMGNVIPGSVSVKNSADIATFGVGTTGSSSTVTVDGNRNIGGINFTGGEGYTLTGSAITLSSGGVIQTLPSDSAATQAVVSAVILEGAASFLSNAPGGSILDFNVGTTATAILEDSGVVGTLTLGGANTGGNSVFSELSNGASGGTLSLLKTGAGSWTLSGSNTYSGTTTVANGTLTLANAANGQLVSTTSLVIEGGGVFNNGAAGAGGGLANRINTSATLTLGGSTVGISGGGSSLNGTFDIVRGSTTANSQSLASLTITADSSDLVSTSGTGSGGTPTLTFSTATPYVRNTAGFVDLNTSAGTSSLTIKFTNAPTGAGNVAGGLLIGAYLQGNDFILAQSGAIAAPGYLAAVSTSASYTSGTNDVNVTANQTLDGAISINALKFNAATAPTFTLTGGNSINAPGILVGNSSGSTSGIATIAGGTIQTSSAGGEMPVYLNGQNLVISSVIGDNGGSSLSVGATTAGVGTLILEGVNTYGGATNIAYGATLQLGSGTSGSDGTIDSSSGITNDGTLIFNRFGNLTSGVAIGGIGNVVMTGPGAETLTANNNYTGTTSVNQGVLIVSGSLSGGGAVTVNSGGTLGGGGVIAGAVTVNTGGTLAPGAAETTIAGATLTLSSGLTLSNSSTLDINLDSSNDIDSLAITGNLSIGSNDTLTLNLLSGAALNQPSYIIATYTGSLTGTFAVTNLPSDYAVDYAVPDEIEIVAIPEPGTWAGLALGALLLVASRRRR